MVVQRPIAPNKNKKIDFLKKTDASYYARCPANTPARQDT